MIEMTEELSKALLMYMVNNPKLYEYLKEASTEGPIEMCRRVSVLKGSGDAVVPDPVNLKLVDASVEINKSLKEIIDLLKQGLSINTPKSNLGFFYSDYQDMKLLEKEDPELHKIISSLPWMSDQKVVDRFLVWMNKPVQKESSSIKVIVDGVEQQGIGNIPSEIDAGKHIISIVKEATYQGCNTLTLEGLQGLKGVYLG